MPSGSPRVIVQCEKGHYSIGEACSHCDAPIIRTLEFRDLDCVACGELCSAAAYCCDSAEPVREDQFDSVFATNVSLARAISRR